MGAKILFDNKKLYDETCSLKKGTGTLSPAMKALRGRIRDRFGVNVLNAFYDLIPIGLAKGRPRLTLIVESEEEHSRFLIAPFTIDKSFENAALGEFSEIVAKLGLQEQYDTSNVLFLWDNFSREAMNQAAEQFRRRDANALVKRFSSDGIWKISGFSKDIVVFFLDEQARRESETSGARDRIWQACYERVKRYDEFNYITPENFDLIFDTKENLDKKFAGSLFYYFR